MEYVKVIDYLNLSKDKDILKMLDDDEKIYYSECLIKIHNSGKSQERIFIITNKNIYNFKKKNLKKKISLTSILGLSYSTMSDEFIIHVKTEEHDYLYISETKIVILCLILILYQEIDDKIIPICEINEKSLRNYITLEKDKKRNKFTTKMNLAYQVNTKSFIDTYKLYIEEAKNELINNPNYQNRVSVFQDFVLLGTSKNIEHFDITKEIKRDVFGPILIGKYYKDNNLYLIKVINKEFLLNNNLIEQKKLEKFILQKLDFPFIYKLAFCFQNKDKIFFGFNYKKTDNLYNQLCISRFFPEDKVKFFASIIGLTLEFLHKNRLIFRDFNLKNISIDEEGFLLFDKFHNVKLIEENDDFDIKHCGNLEYCAPEVIMGYKHSEISDWWCFGIIIYEMLFGIPPFLNDNTDKIYNLILHEEIKFPKNNNISAEAKDLLQKLLVKENNDRLGFEGGFEVIKKHYFFNGIDFKSLEKKKIESPFKPTINDEDNGNYNLFDNVDFIFEKTKSEIHLDIIKKNQDKFVDFYE